MVESVLSAREPPQEPAEALALQVLHDQEQFVAVVRELLDGDDVRVADAGDDARLVHEHVDEGGHAREVRQNAFDHDGPFESARPDESPQHDLRHPTRREQRNDVVSTEVGYGRLTHGFLQDGNVPDVRLSDHDRLFVPVRILVLLLVAASLMGLAAPASATSKRKHDHVVRLVTKSSQDYEAGRFQEAIKLLKGTRSRVRGEHESRPESHRVRLFVRSSARSV